jgi:hypothetical protein
MSHQVSKDHIAKLPSPVAGMNMGHWLGQARLAESQLENILTRTDLDPAQREKMATLLHKVRSRLYEQLEKLNGAQPAQPSTGR